MEQFDFQNRTTDQITVSNNYFKNKAKSTHGQCKTGQNNAYAVKVTKNIKNSLYITLKINIHGRIVVRGGSKLKQLNLHLNMYDTNIFHRY